MDHFQVISHLADIELTLSWSLYKLYLIIHTSSHTLMQSFSISNCCMPNETQRFNFPPKEFSNVFILIQVYHIITSTYKRICLGSLISHWLASFFPQAYPTEILKTLSYFQNISANYLINSMTYGTRRINTALTRALQ